MRARLAFLVLALCLPILGLAGPRAEAPLKFGVQAFRTIEQTDARWRPLADYLESRLGRKVELKVYGWGDLDEALAHNQVDFALTNPSAFIALKHYYSLSAPVATLVGVENGQKLEAYGGVIFARADDARINTLSDLRNKTIATISAQSFGGFRMQALELTDAGLPPPSEAQYRSQVLPLNEVPAAVLSGRADVGFIRTGILEAMARQGQLDLSRLKIINRQNLPAFPYACSTRLYPEWPVAVLPRMDDSTARQLTVALLSLPPDSPAARAAGIQGFTIPADYGGVENLMRNLRLAPFDKDADVRPEDLWRQYKYWIIALSLLVLLLAGFGVALVLQNYRVRLAQQRFATLFEFSPEPMWILSEGRFIECNSAALRVLGYPSKTDVLYRSPVDFSPPYQPDGQTSTAKAAQILAVLDQGQPQRFEWLLRRADGSEFTADVSLALTHLDGRPVVVCAWYDISERKRIEQNLRDTQDELQSTLSAIPDLMFEVDLEGRYYSVRSPRTDLLAAPAADLLGKTVSDVLPAKAAATCLEGLHEALAKDFSGGRQFELPLGGQSKWFEISIARKTGTQSKGPRFVVLSRDVTERKLVEQALQQSRETLRHLANQVPGALYQYQQYPDGRVAIPYASEGFFDLYELTPDALAADGSATRKRWHPDDAMGMLASIAESARTLQPWYHEFRLILPKKGLRWALGNARPEKQADGSTMWHGFIADISEIKRISDELERHRNHLEELLAERTADLMAARDAAEAASRAKSTFLANMSHELRTPMNAIIGMTELALRRAQDAKQIDQLGKVRQASQHLLSVINDILDISKIEAERLSLESIAFEPGSVLENLASMMGDKAREKGLDFRIELAPELHRRSFRGDPLRLSQILLNLIGNALKFTAHGSVIIRAQVAERYEDSALLRFEISDTGQGIAETDRQRLFNAFEQADSSTTRRYGGTGLGLAISRRLVHLMGGDIGVSSVLGSGSTFWFTVRLADAVLLPQPQTVTDKLSPRELLQSRHAGTRILLAEDEPINQEISREILEEVGLQVDVANDGEQAVELASREDYALILMDIQMPRMNGIDATQAIHRLAGREHTTVIAMTANAFNEDRQRCLAAGMHDHIAKPVDPEILFQTLLRWLGQ